VRVLRKEIQVIDSTLIGGGCHCGHVTVTFGSSKPLGELSPKVCECSFCAKHGASYLFDPAGSLRIEARGTEALGEYRQGLEIARFLLCRRCGVLIAALFDDGATSYGAVNARCLENTTGLGAPQVIPPSTSTAEQKRRLWAKVWTPGVSVQVEGVR
jgi:hypothetical protein